MGFFQEFKDFAMRGNVVDLAVGLIIGAEFGKIVNSAVNDVIMPPIGKVLGGAEFTNLKLEIGESKAKQQLVEAQAALQSAAEGSDAANEAQAAVAAAEAAVAKFGENITIKYGAFIQNVFNFVIIAFAVFMVVKVMNSMKKKEEAAPAAPPKDIVLLEEIRDLLAKKA